MSALSRLDALSDVIRPLLYESMTGAEVSPLWKHGTKAE